MFGTLILGGIRGDRLRAADERGSTTGAIEAPDAQALKDPGAGALEDPGIIGALVPGGRRAAAVIDAAALPFIRATASVLPAARPRLIRIDDLERAFPNAQIGGTRLILTQSTYTLQKWVDLLDPADRVVATADRAALERGAPEAFQRRGPWARFEIIDLGASGDPVTSNEPIVSLEVDRTAIGILVRAYRSPSPDERLALCQKAVSVAPESAATALALASACWEQQDATGARRALDLAVALAPDWEAVHYEDGKFWLAVEELDRARGAFQRACDLMATFSAAFSNLGATLGELDQREAALAAFTHASGSDPDNFMILNNIGVVTRDFGRLGESEAALQRVVSLAPEFVFGHYNLGHTLFLGGQYPAALAAYEEGQRRDPQKNRRQGCRLAIVRFANHDAKGAERDLWRFAAQAPPDEREDLLLEAYEVAHALIRDRPELAGHQAFLDRIAAELGN